MWRYSHIKRCGDFLTWTWPGGIAAIVTERWGKDVAEGFTALCSSRAGEAHSGAESARWTAVNGTILEPSQILTTHNLAALTGTLGLQDRLAGLAPGPAGRAFACTVRWLTQDQPTWRAQLHAVKNAAYAWRQAIFFLSLCPQPVQAEALARLRDQVEAAGGEDFRLRFGLAVDGLAHIIAGGRFDAGGTAPEPAAAAGSWAGPSARTGSSTQPNQATPPGPPAANQAFAAR